MRWVLTVVAVAMVAHTVFGASSNTSVLYPATARDFNVENPEFERYGGGGQCGTMEDELGPDRKPVFWGGVTTTGKYLDAPCSMDGTGAAKRPEYVQGWFRDIPGHNIRIPVQLELEEDPPGSGVYRFDRKTSSPTINQFFPIDGLGWGMDLRQPAPSRNFLFTVEVHASFVYRGTEVFNFAGDDDVYVYVNRKLVVDVGGLHPERTGSVSLANVASKVGLVVGQRYDFDFFIAERHYSESNAQIVTTLAPVNERPLTESGAYTLGVGETVVLDLKSFDPDRDVVDYTLFVPDDMVPFVAFTDALNRSLTFTAPDSLDAYVGVNDTAHTFVMSFTVADAEFSACPSNVAVTVTRVLPPPSPPPPAPAAAAPAPPPPDNTRTIVIAAVAGVLGLIAIIGLIALVMFVKSQTAGWKLEILQQLNEETLQESPLYVPESQEMLSPIYDSSAVPESGAYSFF